MAEFCLQCIERHLGSEGATNDFVGISTVEDTVNELYPVVLCEGCGPTQVDHTGRCIHHNEKDHGK